MPPIAVAPISWRQTSNVGVWVFRVFQELGFVLHEVWLFFCAGLEFVRELEEMLCLHRCYVVGGLGWGMLQGISCNPSIFFVTMRLLKWT